MHGDLHVLWKSIRGSEYTLPTKKSPRAPLGQSKRRGFRPVVPRTAPDTPETSAILSRINRTQVTHEYLN